MALISNLKTPDDQTFDFRAGAIPFGEVDSTSTATAFTATVPGVTALASGTTVVLRNGVVTSASGFTINVNGLGAKPVYSNLATGNDVTPTNPTRDTTIFNINYTMMFVYQSDLVSGGAWICYRGYDANTNTIGYQLRTNSGNLVASDTGYRYRLWLTSADGTKWVPINTSTSTNATTARTLNTRKIDPFGSIVYNSTNGTTNSGARPTATALWQQYALTIGYSYVLSMTAWRPVYLKCTPQTDGSAVMDTLTQTLPSTADGYIYIFLGIAYSATAMELNVNHPVYYHDGTALRLWSGAESGGGSTVSVTQIQTSGTEIAQISVDGTSTSLYAPSDSDVYYVTLWETVNWTELVAAYEAGKPIIGVWRETTAPFDSKTYYYCIKAENSISFPQQYADFYYPAYPDDISDGYLGYISRWNEVTKEWENLDPELPTIPSASSTTPAMDGTAAVGTSTNYARADHVHPTDTSRQATLVSGTNIKTINGNSLLGSGDLTIANATTSAAGLMSAIDKQKLDALLTITQDAQTGEVTIGTGASQGSNNEITI